KINWDDAPLTACYYNGLKDRVKDEIAGQSPPTKLSEMVALAVGIDNRQHKREL
ncbi:hypothetical protein K469DRAFT_530089, partial [Zopfia rhizophila CBS 207.26]